MATTPSSLQVVMEVQTSTVGDAAPTPAAGSLEMFANQNKSFYAKDSAGVITPLVNGVTSIGGLTGVIPSGNSVVPVSGALERVIRWQTQISGTNKTYVASDMGKAFSRTNGGVAMVDTLPTITAALDGFTLTIANDDTVLAATNTLTAAAGQFIVSATGGAGLGSFAQNFSRRTELVAVWNGGTTPFWRVHQNNNNLTKGKSGTTFVSGNVPKVSSTSATNGNEIDDSGFPAALSTFTASGFMSATDRIELNSTDGRTSTGTNKRVFRPGDYMVGNTYDPTGSADSSTSWQAMMTAVATWNDRCTIQLPPGVHKIAPGIIQTFGSNNPSVSIVGPGRGVCVLLPTGAGDMIKPNSGTTGSDAFKVSGFTIYNTSGTPYTSGNGINTNGCDAVDITEVAFIDLFNDINVNNAAIKVSIQKTVHFNTNGNGSGVGVLVSNGLAGDTYIGPDVVMSDGGGTTRRRACVEIVESGHYEITQANLTGSQRGILIDPGAGQIVAFGFHTNVLCDSNTINGMQLNALTATSTIKNIKSVNSWYSGTTVINGSAAAAGVLTTGNASGTINGITHSCDRFLNNRTHGYEHTKGTDFRWTDADMKGNSSAGSALSDGLNVAAGVSNWSVNGGKYGGSDTIPTAANQRYGINVAAGAGDFIKIAPDDLSGNVTGPLSMGATGTNVFINGCPGLAAPVSYGPSLATGTTALTVANMLIPKNSVRVGTTFRVTLVLQHSGASTTPTYSVRLGGTNDAVSTAPTNAVLSTVVGATAAASQWTRLQFDLVVSAITAAGNINANFTGWQNATQITTGAVARTSGTHFLAMDTTADRYLTVSVTTAVAAATVYQRSIEVVSY